MRDRAGRLRAAEREWGRKDAAPPIPPRKPPRLTRWQRLLNWLRRK